MNIFEKYKRNKWYKRMVSKMAPKYTGLWLAEKVGLSEEGERMVKRFNRHMKWIEDCRVGNNFNRKCNK